MEKMKNKLIDLNNHLFCQLERLSEEEISPETLAHEVMRTRAITTVAKEIIGNGRLIMDAKIAAKEWLLEEDSEMSGMLSKG